jgi:hypothetical protein
MGSNIVLAFLILFLLSWIYIITGSAKESTYNPSPTLVKELSIVGVVIVLLFIILAVGKIYLKDMMHEPNRTMPYYLKQDIRNRN